jgi:hypothetical protein
MDEKTETEIKQPPQPVGITISGVARCVSVSPQLESRTAVLKLESGTEVRLQNLGDDIAKIVVGQSYSVTITL